MRRFILPAALAVAAFAVVGCAGGTYSAGYAGGYYADDYYADGYYYDGYGPSLMRVRPGLSVVAGYHEPIFYTGNFYWRYDSGRWFRSPYWNRGWVRASPPRVIARIDRPYRYRNYRPSGYTVRRTDRYRDHRDFRRPVIRDQRTHRRPVYRDQRGVRRDLRDQRSDRSPVYRDSTRTVPRTSPRTVTPRRDVRGRSGPIHRDRSGRGARPIRDRR